MDKTPRKNCLKSDLARVFNDFRISASPLAPGLEFANFLSQVRECQVVKESNRRQVYHLLTIGGGCFLKHSSLIRTKDRVRHFLLPHRRWAEWRNLHKLIHARIPAARPLAKGQSKAASPRSYFVLTEQVPGTHVSFNSLENAGKLGQYAGYLHQHGVFHADLNRKNFILSPDGQFYLLDAQEVYFLPWFPRRLKVNNLGRIVFNLCSLDNPEPWTVSFLQGYGRVFPNNINHTEVIEAARRHHSPRAGAGGGGARRYRSRSKRCCKNSTEFTVIKNQHLRGYKRRGFNWGIEQIIQAEQKGESLKGDHVISYRGICIKKHRRKLLHQNRCLASWKMSQALEVRGISVPRSMGYFEFKGQSYFLSELLNDRLHLNAYLSAISDEKVKRQALKKFALWLRTFHDTGVWQRDFKSSNILCRQGDYFMVDLDGVRIRKLSKQKKIVNLAQLNASVSNALTVKDRVRFYRYYSAGHPATRQQRRAVYKKVWEITRTKNTLIFNLDIEKLWPHHP